MLSSPGLSVNPRISIISTDFSQVVALSPFRTKTEIYGPYRILTCSDFGGL